MCYGINKHLTDFYSLWYYLTFAFCFLSWQGGVIARALFTLPGFDAASVHTIITQSSPHQAPGRLIHFVIILDQLLSQAVNPT